TLTTTLFPYTTLFRSSEDGYIVTNNHVISDEQGGVAAEITVTLHNKKVYKARVIGSDPNYDIAVLKIDATNLPLMLYGNSDDVQDRKSTRLNSSHVEI